MPIKATDVKRGQALIFDGQLNVVIGTEHVKPGKGPAYVQAKMKNVETGTIKVNRLNSSDKLEDVNIMCCKRCADIISNNVVDGQRSWTMWLVV